VLWVWTSTKTFSTNERKEKDMSIKGKNISDEH